MREEHWKQLKQIYKNGIPAGDMRFDHHWAKVSTGVPWHSLLRVVRSKDVVCYAPEDKLTPARPVTSFLKYNDGMAMMYPLGFLGIGTGMALRAIHQKEMMTFVRYEDSACFTCSHFYSNPANFRYGTPVILVEGFADAEAVGRYYPFVMATMGGPIKFALVPLLKRVTSRVYTMLDNDEPGNKAVKLIHQRLKKSGTIVKPIKFPEQYKDPADFHLADSGAMYRRLRSVLGSAVRKGQ